MMLGSIENSLREIVAGARDVLPITVVAAIVIFALREGLEAIRRNKTNKRRRIALRRLIADEIERNNWTINRFRECLNEIASALTDTDSKLKIIVDSRGYRHLRREMAHGYAQIPIDLVHSETIAGNILEIAIVDGEIFELALDVSDSIKELEHVRWSMINIIDHEKDFGRLDGFVGYARREINRAEQTLATFYQTITGKPLENRRIR